MLYTLSSMFKLRVYILFFLSLLAASQESINFKNLENYNTDNERENIENQLTSEYRIFYDNWLSEKPVKDVWQKTFEYTEILKIWEENPPPKIIKKVKTNVNVEIGCTPKFVNVACYSVDDEAIVLFDESKISVARDFMRENFENISLYFITEVSAHASKKDFLSREHTHYFILNNDELIKLGVFENKHLYKPVSYINPIYPIRAQERGTMGYALVEFTITDTGSVENAEAIEGYCSNSDPNDPNTYFRSCTMFNSASARAALNLKFKPIIFNGQAIPVHGVRHRFSYVLSDLDN